jgi:hypothetical protein
VSRSSGLFHLEANQARVSLSNLKTGGSVAWMVHVASSRRSRGVKVEDRWVDAMGCIRLFYPNFAILIVLGLRGIFIFSLAYK